MKSFKFTLFCVTFLLALPSYAPAQNPAKQAPSPNVIITTVKKQPFSDNVEALGTLRANETITVTSTVAQTITAINFSDGQRVEKGYALIEMASGEEKAQLDQARAIAAEAKQQLERRQTLVKQGATSQTLVDQAQRDYNSATARQRETQSRLSKFIIAAPFSGVVGLRNISVGALLQPGTKITTLDDDSIMKLDFSVPSLFLSDIKIGMPVIAKAREYPDKSFKGIVSSIDNQIDPVTRSIIVRAEIPNDEYILKSGLLMSVSLLSNQRDALIIPEESLIPEGRDNYVMVIGQDNKAEKRKITLGTRKAGIAEIIDGLSEGEKIITHGTMNARPGQTVNIMADEKGGEKLSDILERAGDKK